MLWCTYSLISSPVFSHVQLEQNEYVCLFLIKVKAVGGKAESMNGETIWKKIRAALNGLEKDTTILTDVLKRSPHRHFMKMQRVVALPNVTRQQLQHVTESKSRELKVK